MSHLFLYGFFKFDFYHRLQCHICFYTVFLNLTFIIDYNVTFVFIRFFKFDFYHRLQCHICFYKVFLNLTFIIDYNVTFVFISFF